MKNLLMLWIVCLTFSGGLFAQGIKQGKMVSGNTERSVQPIKIVNGLWTLPIKTDGIKTDGVKVGKTLGALEPEYIPYEDISVIHAREILSDGTETDNEIQFVVLDSSFTGTLISLNPNGDKEMFFQGVKVGKSQLSLLGRKGLKLQADAYLLVGVSTESSDGEVAIVAIFDNSSQESEESADLIRMSAEDATLTLETSLIYKREPRKEPEMAKIAKFLVKSKFLVIRSWKIKDGKNKESDGSGQISRIPPKKKDANGGNSNRGGSSTNYTDSFVLPK